MNTLKLVKSLLGGSIVATILGVILAGLLINAHFCLMKAQKEGKSREAARCYTERLLYIILLGSSIMASIALGILSWVLNLRERDRQENRQEEEVHYNSLLHVEEEENTVEIQAVSRRDSTAEDFQVRPSPYSAFPPAAMFAH